jgi:hypothetical protein
MGGHLFVFPLTRGTGARLFSKDAAPLQLSLATCEPYDNGVAHLGLPALPSNGVKPG